MPIPKRLPDLKITLAGGPEHGLVMTVPGDTVEIGRWDTTNLYDDDSTAVLYRYAVDADAGTATLIP